MYLAGIGCAAELLIPFLQISSKPEIFLVVLAAAEISFFIGIALLGKSTYKALKLRLVDYIRNRLRS